MDLLNAAAIYRLTQHKQLPHLPKLTSSKAKPPATQLNSPASHSQSHSRPHCITPPPVASSPQQAIARPPQYHPEAPQEEAGSCDHGPDTTGQEETPIVQNRMCGPKKTEWSPNKRQVQAVDNEDSQNQEVDMNNTAEQNFIVPNIRSILRSSNVDDRANPCTTAQPSPKHGVREPLPLQRNGYRQQRRCEDQALTACSIQAPRHKKDDANALTEDYRHAQQQNQELSELLWRCTKATYADHKVRLTILHIQQELEALNQRDGASVLKQESELRTSNTALQQLQQRVKSMCDLANSR